MRNKKVLMMVECAVMIALATTLSVIKLIDMPYGGSVTLGAMLPIAIIAYRHGLGCGMSCALVASVLQLLLGLENFSYVTGWQSIIALALFDYIFAYIAFGLGGIFKNAFKNRGVSLLAGVTLGNIIRYVCHVISGATVWAGLPIPDAAALGYSVSYNATYMIPETIITAALALYIGSAIDFGKTIPTRVKSEGRDGASELSMLLAGLVLAVCVVVDSVLIFKHLQLPSGEFGFIGLSAVNWTAVCIVSAVCALLITALVIYSRYKRKNS